MPICLAMFATRRHAVVGCGILTLAFVLALALSSIVAAQDSSGMLPKPITRRELSRYADRLQLSQQQRRALSALHDQYKSEFRALREGEIAAFLKQVRTLYDDSMPRRDVVAELLKKSDQLVAKIAALDQRLFDGMQATLTDAQLAVMPRVRLARQRARYIAQEMMWTVGDRPPDISELVLDLDLTPEAAAQIDAALSQYESALTAGMGKAHELAGHMILDIFEALDSLGFSEASMEDPETQERVAKAMQEIYRQATAKTIQAAADLNDLNRRTYRNLRAMLPAEYVRPFCNRFFMLAYPEASLTLSRQEAILAAALKLEGLAPDQVASITAMRDAFIQKADQLRDAMADIIDESRRHTSPWDEDTEISRQRHHKLSELRTSAEEHAEQVSEALEAALGPELPKQLNRLALAEMRSLLGRSASRWAMELEDLDETKDADDADFGDDEGEVLAALPGAGSDMFLPPPITEAEVNDYFTMLDLTESQRAVARQLHKNYLEGFQAIEQGPIAAVLDASRNMWTAEAGGGQPTNTGRSAIDEAYRLRRVAMAAIQQADHAFFDDLELAVITPEQAPRMERVRLARERSCWQRTSRSASWYRRSNLSSIDLSLIVRRQRLAPAELAKIDAILIEYERAMTLAFRDRYEAAMEAHRVQDQFAAQGSRLADGEVADYELHMKEYRHAMTAAWERARQANLKIIQMNKDALAQCIAALPAESAAALQSHYNRVAYPEIYSDRMTVSRQLDDALRLTDLSEQQRREIADLAAEYRPAYADLCEQMVNASISETDDMFVMDEEDPQTFQRYMELQEAMVKLRFDRAELNARAAERLRMILTREQLARIGNLPESGAENEFDVDEW